MLPPQAIKLIETQERLTPYVFYSLRGTGYMWGLSELKRDFQAQLPPEMPRWTIHDLRRTARTYMAEKDVPFHVAEKILGHSLKGVAGIYDQSKLVPQMKIALVTLADHIAKVVGENVTQMAQAG
jgi:integrase